MGLECLKHILNSSPMKPRNYEQRGNQFIMIKEQFVLYMKDGIQFSFVACLHIYTSAL